MLTGDEYAHPAEGSWSGREVADKDRERLTLLTATQEADHNRRISGRPLDEDPAQLFEIELPRPTTTRLEDVVEEGSSAPRMASDPARDSTRTPANPTVQQGWSSLAPALTDGRINHTQRHVCG